MINKNIYGNKNQNIDELEPAVVPHKTLSKVNRYYILFFIFFVIFVFLLLFMTELFNDLGWWNGRFHINYYHNPAGEGNHPNYLDPYYNVPHKDWALYGLSDKDPLWAKWNTRLVRQPNLFWAFTQFTWLTTFVVFTTIIVRFFKYQDKWPKSFKWIISHNTLYLITVLDTIVMIVFWSALFKDFTNNFSPDETLKIMRMVVTILVHGAIPLLLIIYTSVFAINDSEADVLNRWFFIIGTMLIVSYLIFYILLSFTWDDPYAPFTNLRSGKGWWQMFALLGLLEFVMLISFYINNFVIIKFNKYYKKKIAANKLPSKVKVKKTKQV